MKNKIATLVLMTSLIMSVSGVVFAQGSRPPANSDGYTASSKSLLGVHQNLNGDMTIRDIGNNELGATTAIVNGDFEQGGFVGWSETSSKGWLIVVPSPFPPHSGSWAAWLGGDNNELAIISQTNVSIFTPTTLRLWYWVDSGDSCGYDYGYVKVNSNIVHTWDLCYSNNSSGWLPLNIDLSAYNGQTVTLSVEVVTDASYFSNLFIDDVSLYRTFADVPYGYWSQDFIERLFGAGITGGCGTGPLVYCPDNTVTRAEMAVFLERGSHYPVPYAAPNVAPTFNDTVGHWAEDWIEALKNDGITSGCGNGNYCPEASVTRAQMAVFLLRARYGSNYTPPNATGVFADVPVGYWADDWIEQLAAESITGGCGAGIYCPDAPVTRAQMAVFLVRTFNLP
jgi:hypothetical protein